MMNWWQDAKANKIFHLTALVAVGVFLFDQATKLWVLHVLKLQDRLTRQIDLSPIFDLTYVENRGVSFGMFAGGMTSRIILTILAVGVAAYVIHWAGRLNRREAAIGAGFIVGGAIGNALDRSMYGFVVDFLDFSGLYFPWVFNIADVGVNIGVAFLAYDAFFVMPKQEKNLEQLAKENLTESKES